MVVYGHTQHAGLAENVLDHRLNCRTVYINPVNNYLYWNMNHHVEHHMFLLVPYHAFLHAQQCTPRRRAGQGSCHRVRKTQWTLQPTRRCASASAGLCRAEDFCREGRIWPSLGADSGGGWRRPRAGVIDASLPCACQRQCCDLHQGVGARTSRWRAADLSTRRLSTTRHYGVRRTSPHRYRSRCAFTDAWRALERFEMRAANANACCRNYSLASNPACESRLHFNARLAKPPAGSDHSAGAGSAWVFTLKQGDIISAIGLFGDFHLLKVCVGDEIRKSARELLFIGGVAGHDHSSHHHALGPLRAIRASGVRRVLIL